MSTVLAYTSPARGHLEPMLDVLAVLAARGWDVHVRTLAALVDDVRAAGPACAPIAPEVEAVVLDDHRYRSASAQARRVGEVWTARAALEPADLRAAVAEVRPDLLLLDTTTAGAKAAAEADGLPWAEVVPFLVDPPTPGLPPLGLGLRPRSGLLGRLRDAAATRMVASVNDRLLLDPANAGRAAAGLPPLGDAGQAAFRAPVTLLRTARPFAWARDLPPGALAVGPSRWRWPAAAPEVPPDDGRPLVLVTCSTEFQDDGAIARAAAEGLAAGHRLVVTTGAVDPATVPAPPGRSSPGRFRTTRWSSRPTSSSATVGWGSPSAPSPRASRWWSSPGDATRPTSPPTSPRRAPASWSRAAG